NPRPSWGTPPNPRPSWGTPPNPRPSWGTPPNPRPSWGTPPNPRAEVQGRTDRPEVEQAAHPESNGHDHCDVLAVRHHLPDVGAPVAEASLVCITPASDGGEGVEARPVPLLCLAPKGSPPVA